ncbi:protein O-mannosyl-transferase Tmtc2-like isoform X2 [Halichondria panicea]|uniref:protein O-mannosyl-transferase Tmtc2-like isoform X2 n=1 Tax=Halichondria panicea TaxID=6063 RepID=UPI00312BB51B
MSPGGGSLNGCLAVAGFAAALYLNSLNGEFVFDDHEAIETNMDVRTNTPLSQVFSNDFWGQPLSDPESHKSYRPLVILSFRTNRLLHGLWAPGFHLVNTVLHAAVTALYYQLLCRLRLEWSTVVTASLLFAAHPIHTEAVSNIVGRTELLCALFFLLSFLLYDRSLPQRRPSTHSWLRLCLSICLAVSSMLCKEQGVTVLGVCLVYDLFVVCQLDLVDLLHCGKIVLKSLYFKLRGHKAKKRHPAMLPRWLTLLTQRSLFLILSACVIVFCRLYINGGGKPLFVESDNPASFSEHPLTRWFTYSYLVTLNVWLLLCPSWLCFDWSMGSVPLVTELTDLRNMATCFLFGTLFIFLLWTTDTLERISSHNSTALFQVNNGPNSTPVDTPAVAPVSKATSRRRGIVLLSLSLAVLPFLPATNLFFPVGFVVAERILYLPSMGFCLLVAIGYSKLVKLSPPLRPLMTIFLLLSVTTFSVKTLLRNGDWTGTEALASSAIPVNPGNAKVFMSLGTYYTQLGQRRCELFYHEALRLRPNYTAAWTNLGLVMINTDRPVEAERCYTKALSIKSDHINANTNMGHLCRLQGRWEDASRYYQTVLQRRPNNVVLRYNLGLVAMSMEGAENLQRAEEEFGRVVQLEPHHWESHAALASLLATTTTNGRRVAYGFTKGKRLDQDGKVLVCCVVLTGNTTLSKGSISTAGSDKYSL